MRRLACLVAALGGAAVLGATSTAGTNTASILIRHQTHGCHTWSVGNGVFRASQTVHLARGGTLTIVNDDVMPQPLFQKSGPKAQTSGNSKLDKIGASVKVTFTKAGTYRFATKAGEDYPGVKAPTVGEDNNLTLTVIVA
ncbi:MAG: cupredoxin domain-containing protein [Gaiellaceae bacterium]